MISEKDQAEEEPLTFVHQDLVSNNDLKKINVVFNIKHGVFICHNPSTEGSGNCESIRDDFSKLKRHLKEKHPSVVLPRVITGLEYFKNKYPSIFDQLKPRNLIPVEAISGLTVFSGFQVEDKDGRIYVNEKDAKKFGNYKKILFQKIGNQEYIKVESPSGCIQSTSTEKKTEINILKRKCYEWKPNEKRLNDYLNEENGNMDFFLKKIGVVKTFKGYSLDMICKLKKLNPDLLFEDQDQEKFKKLKLIFRLYWKETQKYIETSANLVREALKNDSGGFFNALSESSNYEEVCLSFLMLNLRLIKIRNSGIDYSEWWIVGEREEEMKNVYTTNFNYQFIQDFLVNLNLLDDITNIDKLHQILKHVFFKVFLFTEKKTSTPPFEAALFFMVKNQNEFISHGRYTENMSKILYFIKAIACYETKFVTAVEKEQLYENIFRYSTLCQLNTPFNSFYEIRSESRQKGIPGDLSITWNDDVTELIYKNQNISAYSFKLMADNLLKEAEAIFIRDICQGFPVQLINLNSLADDINETAVNHSFLNNPDNVQLFNKLPKFIDFIIENDEIRKLWFSEALVIDDSMTCRTLPWKKDKIVTFLSNTERFEKKMYAYMHTVGGQTARSSEESVNLIVNTLKVRSLYIYNSIVMMYETYNKSQTLSNQTKGICRFLGTRSSQLLVNYLIYIRPVQCLFNYILNGNDTSGFTQFLWCNSSGSSLSSDQLRKSFKNEFNDNLKIKLTDFRIFRHMVIALSNRFIDGYNIDSDESQERSIFNIQNGHSKKTSNANYGISNLDFRCLGRDVVSHFYRATLEWHRLLDIDDGLHKGLNSEEARKKIKIDKGDVSNFNFNLKDLFNEFMNDDSVQFRKGQEKALNEIFINVNHLIIGYPTGIGKSLLYLLPAFYYYKTKIRKSIIVVIPNIILLRDQIMKARSGSFEFYVYNPLTCTTDINFDRPPQLIYVQVEYSDNEVFMKFCQSISTYISHIFFDECHLLELDKGFRGCMTRTSSNLMKIPGQLIFMSATIPKSLELILKKTFFSGITNVKVLRESCRDRFNQFNMDIVNDVGDNFKNSVKKLMDVHFVDNKSRGIIYCPTKKQCDKVFNQIKNFCVDGQIGVYNSSYSEEAEDIITKFRVGEIKLMIATCGFGVGLDYSHVRFIIHKTCPYSLLHFCQEIGRGGRDGNLVDTLVISSTNSINEMIEYTNSNNIKIFYDWYRLENNDIRKNTIISYLDGKYDFENDEFVPVFDIDDGQINPSNPKQPPNIIHMNRVKMNNYSKTNELESIKLKQYIELDHKKCAVCYVVNSENNIHNILECNIIKKHQLCIRCFDVHSVNECKNIVKLKVDGSFKCKLCFLSKKFHENNYDCNNRWFINIILLCWADYSTRKLAVNQFKKEGLEFNNILEWISSNGEKLFLFFMKNIPQDHPFKEENLVESGFVSPFTNQTVVLMDKNFYNNFITKKKINYQSPCIDFRNNFLWYYNHRLVNCEISNCDQNFINYPLPIYKEWQWSEMIRYIESIERFFNNFCIECYFIYEETTSLSRHSCIFKKIINICWSCYKYDCPSLGKNVQCELLGLIAKKDNALISQIMIKIWSLGFSGGLVTKHDEGNRTFRNYINHLLGSLIRINGGSTIPIGIVYALDLCLLKGIPMDNNNRFHQVIVKNNSLTTPITKKNNVKVIYDYDNFGNSTTCSTNSTKFATVNHSFNNNSTPSSSLSSPIPKSIVNKVEDINKYSLNNFVKLWNQLDKICYYHYYKSVKKDSGIILDQMKQCRMMNKNARPYNCSVAKGQCYQCGLNCSRNDCRMNEYRLKRDINICKNCFTPKTTFLHFRNPDGTFSCQIGKGEMPSNMWLNNVLGALSRIAFRGKLNDLLHFMIPYQLSSSNDFLQLEFDRNDVSEDILNMLYKDIDEKGCNLFLVLYFFMLMEKENLLLLSF